MKDKHLEWKVGSEREKDRRGVRKKVERTKRVCVCVCVRVCVKYIKRQNTLCLDR